MTSQSTAPLISKRYFALTYKTFAFFQKTIAFLQDTLFLLTKHLSPLTKLFNFPRCFERKYKSHVFLGATFLCTCKHSVWEKLRSCRIPGFTLHMPVYNNLAYFASLNVPSFSVFHREKNVNLKIHHQINQFLRPNLIYSLLI